MDAPNLRVLKYLPTDFWVDVMLSSFDPPFITGLLNRVDHVLVDGLTVPVLKPSDEAELAFPRLTSRAPSPSD